MKKSLYIMIGILLAAGGLLAYKNLTNPDLKLLVFKSEDCGPCLQLTLEMEEQKITQTFDVDVDGCLVQVPFEIVMMENFEGKPPGKNTDFLPEETLMVAGKVSAYDYFSNVEGIQLFLAEQLRHMQNLQCT